MSRRRAILLALLVPLVPAQAYELRIAEGTNTLVVRASAQDYQQIRKVLERLDSSPRQVLVQVMVAEVALNDTLQYGLPPSL